VILPWIAISWPLLFPSSLKGSSQRKDAIAIAFLDFFPSFAVPGFLFGQKLTRKYVREETGSSGRVLFP
jgi:hypothetical protein